MSGTTLANMNRPEDRSRIVAESQKTHNARPPEQSSGGRRLFRNPTAKAAAEPDLHSVGTAGFECNGPHAGPLFYRHLRAPKDRIGSYRQLWTGKHYGKHLQPVWMLPADQPGV